MFRFIFILLYKLFYRFRKYKRLIFPTEKIRPVYIFINRYIAQIVIVTLVILISFGNLFTSETKAENFGDQSLLFTLASGSEYAGSYIEEGLISAEPQINSYLSSEQATVSPDNAVQPEENNSLAFTSDSSALVKPEIPSLEAVMPTRTNIVEYTVKAGDTIGTIAQKFGLGQNTLLWENNLTARSYIQPGQILKILPTNGISYAVVKGDNLGKIAQKFNSETGKIIAYNRLSDESDIQIGQILIIPEGKPYAPPPVVTPKLASIKQIFNQPVSAEPDDPGTGKMYWPNGCYTLTQYFNWRHVGLDIACPKGTPIRAAEDGVVYKVAYLNTGYGHHVFIDHGNGKTTRYGHMTTIFVKEGETVKRGQEIGLEGSTGMSTGPHLHFEVRINNKPYNPLNYLR